MIKSIIFTLLILFGYQAIAQKEFVLTGKIIDNKTKVPVPYATIVYQNKSIGTISNSNGYFTLSLFNANETDSLIISYVGYESIRTTIAESMQYKTYNLKPSIFEISEVVIKAKKFKLKSFIKEVIADYNKNRKSEPHIAISHYREKAKEDGKYIMYMESIGYSIFAGKQENASPLSNYKFYCENTKCHVINPSWINYKEDNKESVTPSGSSNLNVFRYLESKGLLSNKYYRKYNYKIDSTYFIGNNPVYCIGFKGSIAKGSVHILVDSKQIIRIDCLTDKYWSNAFHKRLDAQVSIQFNYFDNTSFISSINANYEYKSLEYQNSLEVLVQKFNDFKLNKDEYWSMNTYASNPYIEYLPKEWKSYDIKEDDDFGKIETDLSSTTNLDKLFVNYSGRWFFANDKGSELVRSKIKKLKLNF